MAANYPTKKQKNGFKLQLLRDKCEEYQRKHFHNHFSTDPKILYTELQNHDQTFQSLLKTSKLRQQQHALLFPASQETDSGKFDCTLLALLLRTVCPYKKPFTGWNNEPDINDRSDIANLIRLKIGRNEIQHNRLECETKEYMHWYNFLMRPLIELGCPIQDIRNLLSSFEYGIFNADPIFTGRQDELLDIKNNIQNDLNDGVVLIGIGGVGKSQTAKKY